MPKFNNPTQVIFITEADKKEKLNAHLEALGFSLTDWINLQIDKEITGIIMYQDIEKKLYEILDSLDGNIDNLNDTNAILYKETLKMKIAMIRNLWSKIRNKEKLYIKKEE